MILNDPSESGGIETDCRGARLRVESDWSHPGKK